MTTTQEIQARHDSYEEILAEMRIAYANRKRKPLALLMNREHTDRGILLKRLMTTTNYCILCEEMGRKLKAAEDKLQKIAEMPDKWRFEEGDNCTSVFSLDGYDCADEIESIIEGKS